MMVNYYILVYFDRVSKDAIVPKNQRKKNAEKLV